MKYYVLLILIFSQFQGRAQSNSLVDFSKSPFAKLRNVNLDDVRWTDGFWKEQFDVEVQETLPYIWKLYHDDEVTHAYRNFEIAAGLMKGKHDGPSFHDGDFYKVFEGMAATYAITKDQDLDKQMDEAIALIAKAQRDDGYIHTPVLIEERWGTLGPEELKKQLGFEKYNMGHLMTAACVHYRATGKSNFLEVATGVADFLYDFYKKASPELARNAICPSHYMGVIEMYRTVNDENYLELANNLINIRGMTADGTDDNQDRIPFREQTTAMGHAVRANYLYAGVADLYAETGEQQLLDNLKSIWKDVVHRKMYITGACGSLYDGVSPDGTVYDPAKIQKIHQAYGRPYQLPNATAHNETCANIGNVLWNWRMLQITADSKYADIVELALYNSVLSGISLEGKEFCYNNPLNVSKDLPFEQRWGSIREGYIKLSNCCAPNVTRTLAEINNYAYSLSNNGVYFNLYGSNYLKSKSQSGESIEIKQTSNYPWDGDVHVEIIDMPKEAFNISLRIPGWCTSSDVEITINGVQFSKEINSASYLSLNRQWKKGDSITLRLPMPVELMTANSLVEETRNQVTLKRGPLVYCLETENLPKDVSINNLKLNLNSEFKMIDLEIDGRSMVGLKSHMFYNPNKDTNSLYQRMDETEQSSMQVLFKPYYSWGNQGKEEMTVWMPYQK